MYITNKEIIRCLFDNEEIDHVIISDSGNTSCTAFDNKHNIVETIYNVSITIDNECFNITMYDDFDEPNGMCSIPLLWLIRNSKVFK